MRAHTVSTVHTEPIFLVDECVFSVFFFCFFSACASVYIFDTDSSVLGMVRTFREALF